MMNALANAPTCTACGVAPVDAAPAGDRAPCPACARRHAARETALTATAADRHRTLLRVLAAHPHIPLDLFDGVVVTEETAVCVPGYLFACEARAAYTYEEENGRAGAWRPVRADVGFSARLFASAHRSLAEPVLTLFRHPGAASPEPPDDAGPPPEGAVRPRDLSEAAAFREQVKPQLDVLARREVARHLRGRVFRNLDIGPCRADSSARPVRLCLVRLRYTYRDAEYEVWMDGAGRRAHAPAIPLDERRKERYHQKADRAAGVFKPAGRHAVLALLGLAGSVWLSFTALGAAALVFALYALFRLLFAAGHNGALREAREAFERFDGERREAVRRFAERRRPFAGVYADRLRGDPAAFAEPDERA